MEYDIQSSINNFESKKDFREVKLRTRNSFREDQHALNKRLSLRTNQAQKSRVNKMDSKTNPDVLGNAETIAMTRQYGKMVFDSKKHLAKRSENGDYVNNGYSDVDDVTLDITLTEDVETELPQYFVRGFKSTDQQHNGEVGGNAINIEKGVVVNSSENDDQNGESNTETRQGDPLPSGDFLVRRPTIREKPRGCATPEPRLKANGHIYKKNEKLAAGSTHWDRMADKEVLKGHGSPRTDTQYVPVVPGKEVPFLPVNGSLRGFTVDQMVTIFRHLGVPENIIFHLSDSKIDGNRFAALSDIQLEELRIKNPIICYFRNKSGSVAVYKKRPKFML